ncbi:hypothetical protein [Clostridium saccharoperbutylacetonicum]|nr:hypothetical protein [Clostridium saccharoperbutylacetonicum]
MKEEFYSIINKVKEQYSFQFLDYFNNKLFEDSDFYDVSHLNEIGAEKFTRILNKDIIWDTDSV